MTHSRTYDACWSRVIRASGNKSDKSSDSGAKNQATTRAKDPVNSDRSESATQATNSEREYPQTERLARSTTIMGIGSSFRCDIGLLTVGLSVLSTLF